MPRRTLGRFPFGQPVREVNHEDDGKPRRVFVLGVYASAVHAQWTMNGKTMVRALAVASEPRIFWTGEDADEIVAKIKVPKGLGGLRSAGEKFNGPSGRALDSEILTPLGLTRKHTWLCDLRPYASLNPQQAAAIERNEKLIQTTMPSADGAWATDARRAEILDELKRSKARVLITLGDQPLQHFVAQLFGQPARLSAYTYGQLTPIALDGLSLHLLPLAHPRQIAKLGAHSPKWHAQHHQWKDHARDVLKKV